MARTWTRPRECAWSMRLMRWLTIAASCCLSCAAATQRQFALYRVLRGTATQAFRHGRGRRSAAKQPELLLIRVVRKQNRARASSVDLLWKNLEYCGDLAVQNVDRTDR